MDRIDIKILNILQKDASLPLATIAKKVDLSTTPCFNRIKKLEEMGVIKKRVAILDNKKINLPIVVFLSITVAQHSKEWLEKFIDKLSSFDEVVEIYRLTGNSDYLIKIVAKSIEQYDNFNQVLIKEINFRSLSSNIVLKEIKNTNILPLKEDTE
tara:strand:- start:618 stop:1082 length:465 start_codon:yes stop_codon:yes gene_type:complete